MKQPYHHGQIKLQERSGLREIAQKVGNSIKSGMPEVAQNFVSQQSMVMVGSVDPKGRLWASMLTGSPGFIDAPDDHHVTIDAKPATGDALNLHVDQVNEIGLLFIDPQSRRRMVFAGETTLDEQGRLLVNGQRVFSQCPKYIQQRQLVETNEVQGGTIFHQATTLNAQQQRRLANADTFFIATHHPQTGPYVSHRGGNPGFVNVLDESTLLFPDYSGNTMFLTLGNLDTNPNAGLLMVDFETGDLLQLSGKAYLLWDHRKKNQFPGALHLVSFTIEHVNDIQDGHPLRWKFEAYSPMNPTSDQ